MIPFLKVSDMRINLIITLTWVAFSKEINGYDKVKQKGVAHRKDYKMLKYKKTIR